MNIILEGPDGTGKSTLAKRIAGHINWMYTPGQGPERYPGEIVERGRQYLEHQFRVFDRHPIISQPIYNRFRTDGTPIPQELIDELAAQNNLLILCDRPEQEVEHVLKDYDTEEHVAMVEDNADAIYRAYIEWSMGRVHGIYRIGDPVENVLRLCQEYVNARPVR